MKVGIQTVSWGPRLDALADICGPLHRAGCIGLELSQKPHNLPDGKELAEQFSTNQMLIAGLSGGGISSRMRLRQTGLDFDYLYCDTWSDEMSQLAIATDACIAIHPHVFRGVRNMAAATVLLNHFPNTRLIIDTAHFHIAKDDPFRAFNEFRDRIIAIHLKDWTAHFGISPYRYARGFCALGDGDLAHSLVDFIKLLASSSFTGWVIIEQNTSGCDPLAAAIKSLDWLQLQLD